MAFKNMKRFVLILLFLLFSWHIVSAQGQYDNKKKTSQQSFLGQSDKEGDKIIPLTIDQAEKLATEIVYNILKQRSKIAEAEFDRKVMNVKIEALKRKMIDEALAKKYNTDTNKRLDRLEQIIYLLILNNNKNISLQDLHSLINPQADTSTIILSHTNSEPQLVPNSVNGVDTLNLSLTMVPENTENNEFERNVETSLDSLMGVLSTKNMPTESKMENKKENKNENENEKAPSFHFQIFFRVGEANINDYNSKMADKVVEYLLANPNIHVQLSGYASPEGSVERNNILSGQRVGSVYNYLLTNGISPNRMSIYTAGINSVTKTREEARRVDILLYSK